MRLPILLVLVASVPLLAQERPSISISQTVEGNQSPAVAGAKGNVTITYEFNCPAWLESADLEELLARFVNMVERMERAAPPTFSAYYSDPRAPRVDSSYRDGLTLPRYEWSSLRGLELNQSTGISLSESLGFPRTMSGWPSSPEEMGAPLRFATFDRDGSLVDGLSAPYASLERLGIASESVLSAASTSEPLPLGLLPATFQSRDWSADYAITAGYSALPKPTFLTVTTSGVELSETVASLATHPVFSYDPDRKISTMGSFTITSTLELRYDTEEAAVDDTSRWESLANRVARFTARGDLEFLASQLSVAEAIPAESLIGGESISEQGEMPQFPIRFEPRTLY